MRTVLAAFLMLLAGSAAADPKPGSFPKVCVADSPDADAPCTSFEGTYQLRVLPSKDRSARCFVQKPLAAEVTIGGAVGGGHVELDASKLVRKLGWSPRRRQQPEAGAAIRKGVCCVDVRIYETKGRPDREIWKHLYVYIARGATRVNALAREEILHDHDAPGDDCDNDLEVEVTLPQ